MVPVSPAASTVSAAERRLFALLEATEIPGAVCLHSLRLHEHETKKAAEADFVVVMPAGVLVIEVKGGRVSHRGGTWFYKDRHDVVHHSNEGPFKQAESAMYALERRLQKLGGDDVTRSFSFGFAVATPDCLLATSTIEWDATIVIDEGTVRRRDELADVVERICAHWRERGRHRGTATKEEIEAVVQLCRPDFEPIETIGARAAALERQFVTATSEQYRILDVLPSFDRVVIEGGAGTGKTLLAVETCRRLEEQGGSVVLTCHEPALAEWLRHNVPRTVRVVTHRSLGSLDEPAGVLVVDEAQDVMTEDGIDALSAAVEGGLLDGRWVAFMDARHQANTVGRFETEVYALLLAAADSPRALELTENVRNTQHVLVEVEQLTGVSLPPSRVKGGLPTLVAFAETPAGEATLLEEWLRELRDEEVEPGSITILTGSTSPAFLGELRPRTRRGLDRVGVSAASAWPPRGLTWCPVSEFKGLENEIVLLADLWDRTEAADPVLYVGMTRARDQLRSVWPARVSDDLETRRLSWAKQQGSRR